jgi:predicted nucleic acid-binding protein
VASTIVDTNIVVYSYDPRDLRKRHIAAELLRHGLAEQSICLSYQAVVEFYAAVTRRDRNSGIALLDHAAATRETEKMLAEFVVLYPTDDIIRAAMEATAVYQLPWYDALMWAYAEVNGLTELLSEDFQHGRLYGRVRVRNPFL